MKYKLNVKKKAGFTYSVEDGVLKINDTLVEEPTDENIIEYDLTEAVTDLGISRCYRENGEVICHLTLFVTDLEPFKSGKCVKDGKSYTASSKWDLTKLLTADEVVNGTIVPQEEVVDV